MCVLERESMRGKHLQPSRDGVRRVGDCSCVGGEGMNTMQGYGVDELRYERGFSYTTQPIQFSGCVGREGWQSWHDPCAAGNEVHTTLQDIWSNA